MRTKGAPANSELGRHTRPTISLLHATYHREAGPLEVKSCWLERADRPDLVDHVFAMDDDDVIAIEQTSGHRRVIGPADPFGVTAVRNWNAAAKIAQGDLLLVVADDLFPPRHWDTQLVRIIGELDPKTVSFAVKVTDGPNTRRVLLRHPVVSRTYFEEYGLFSDHFRGVFCDNDITVRAFWHALILDGRSLVLQHRHPALGTAARSESHQRIMETGEYERGKQNFRSAWPFFRRHARVQLVSATERPLRYSDLPTPCQARVIKARAVLVGTCAWTARLLLRPGIRARTGFSGSRRSS